MGSALVRNSIYQVLFQLNSRFAPGAPIREMVKIQKEHNVFSAENSLQQAHRMLHIGPTDFTERELYYKLLDELKKVPSDNENMNGYERIVEARRSNLTSKTPLPMYTKTHISSENAGVKVIIGDRPHPGDRTRYVTISIPEPINSVWRQRKRST